MEGEIKFGRKQYGKPIPKKISNRIDLWSAIIGIIIWAANSAPFLSAEQASLFSWFMGPITAVIQVLKQFYSVEVNEKMVSTDNVDVIDTEPDK